MPAPDIRSLRACEQTDNLRYQAPFPPSTEPDYSTKNQNDQKFSRMIIFLLDFEVFVFCLSPLLPVIAGIITSVIHHTKKAIPWLGAPPQNKKGEEKKR